MTSSREYEKMATARDLVLPPPPVVGKQYVSSDATVLHTVKKCFKYRFSGDYEIRDGNKELVFKGHNSGCIWKKFVLTNEIDGSLITLRRQPLRYGRWKAYSGAGYENLLFESKRHCRSTKIYLPTNISKTQPDYTIKRKPRVGLLCKEYEVFYGHQLIAQTTREGFKFGKRKNFMAAVPNTDQAFIAAILALLEYQMEPDKRD